MTNFENLKRMTQDEAAEYMRNGLCKIYGDCCKQCPMDYDSSMDGCICDVFANWLEIESEEVT